MLGQGFSVRMVRLMGFGMWAFCYLSFGIGLFGQHGSWVWVCQTKKLRL